MSPYPLLWLRYTTFIPLYPLGVASEMTMVALALPHIRKSQMWSIRMPNAFNFAFDYFLFCLLAVAIYIPGRCLVVMCIVIDISCQFALCMHAADLVVGGTCSFVFKRKPHRRPVQSMLWCYKHCTPSNLMRLSLCRIPYAVLTHAESKEEGVGETKGKAVVARWI